MMSADAAESAVLEQVDVRDCFATVCLVQRQLKAGEKGSVGTALH